MTAAPEWFAAKFKTDSLAIKTFSHWTWSLRPTQCTLGASVLSLNREAQAWGSVTAEENSELALVVAEIERRLGSAFGYEKINYLMLMMVDPHVHFHVIPRYSKAISQFGFEWQDSNWPKPPDLAAGTQDPALLEQVLALIKST